MTFIRDYKPPSMAHGERGLQIGDSHIAALLTWEGGGTNGLEPLLVGAAMDVPVLDADLMGRAFPEICVRTTLNWLGCSGHGIKHNV